MTKDKALKLVWPELWTYTTPPAAERPWVGLAKEEAIQMFNDVCRGKSFDVHRIQDFYKAIEAALRSKNYG
jgi:hypothetical protein